MAGIKRIWDDAITKRDGEGECRVCGQNSFLEAAHIIGRRADRYELDGTPRNTKTYRVEAVRIVPLCGVKADTRRGGCHTEYDAHALDLANHLTPEEMEQAQEAAAPYGP